MTDFKEWHIVSYDLSTEIYRACNDQITEFLSLTSQAQTDAPRQQQLNYQYVHEAFEVTRRSEDVFEVEKGKKEPCEVGLNRLEAILVDLVRDSINQGQNALKVRCD